MLKKVFYKKVIVFLFPLTFLFQFIASADEFDDFINKQNPTANEFQVDNSPRQNSNQNVIRMNDIQNGSSNFNNMAPLKPATSTAPIEPPYKKSVVSGFKNWTVLSANPKGNPMYYALIYAKRRIGNVERKDSKAYFMVHYFSYYKQRISFFFDYKIKSGSKVFMSIDKRQFVLNPFENYAFSDDAETDAAIISALLTAKRVLVRAEGDGNAYSVDEYEVIGFPKIYTEMKERYIQKNHVGVNERRN
jgi:hypothetical protein